MVVAWTLDLNLLTARSVNVLPWYRAVRGVEDARGGWRQATVKLMPEVVQLVIKMAERQPDITLKVIKDSLADKRNVAVSPVIVSVTSLSWALNGQLITTKKLQDCPAQQNSVRIKRDRAVYAAWYLAQGKHVHLNYSIIQINYTFAPYLGGKICRCTKHVVFCRRILF